MRSQKDKVSFSYKTIFFFPHCFKIAIDKEKKKFDIFSMKEKLCMGVGIGEEHNNKYRQLLSFLC